MTYTTETISRPLHHVEIPREIGEELDSFQDSYNLEDDVKIKEALANHILQIQYDLLYPVTITEETIIKLQKNGFIPPTETQFNRDKYAALEHKMEKDAMTAVEAGKPDPRVNRPRGFRVNLKDGTHFETILSKLGQASWSIKSKKRPDKFDLMGCNWQDFEKCIVEYFDVLSIEKLA